MYTSITLSGYSIFNKLKVHNLSHRAAYKATLKLINRNNFPYYNKEVKLIKVEHHEKSYTHILLLADGRHPLHVYINTYFP